MDFYSQSHIFLNTLNYRFIHYTFISRRYLKGRVHRVQWAKGDEKRRRGEGRTDRGRDGEG